MINGLTGRISFAALKVLFLLFIIHFLPVMKPIASPRIIFLGTPQFAVASLKALLDAGFNIVAVVTSPDKPAGRGMQMQESAVKVFAKQNQLPVLQPPKLKAPDFLEELKAYNADVQVVVAFRMLPEVVWNMPPLGTINVHASLLPQYRGAAPINWAIINGETKTGVTTFRLQHAIDTGNILLQNETEITPEDNAGTLHDKLMEAGAALIVETLQGIMANNISEKPQTEIEETELQHAPKIFKEHTLIDWNQPVKNIENQVKGLSPYPAAQAVLQGKVVKIFSVQADETETKIPAGNFETDGKTFLRFAASNGFIYLKELQQEGKKKIDTGTFLRGFRV